MAGCGNDRGYPDYRFYRSYGDLIQELLEKWARWRIHFDHGLGYPQDSVGRALSGVPGTKCPICQGQGKVSGERIGVALQYIICPTCGGAGKVKMDPNPKKANPAFIRSTSPRIKSDPMSEKIDYLVCTALEKDENAVIFMEYTRIGNQNQKLARLKKTGRKLGITFTHSLYNQTLISAENKIDYLLTL